MGIGTTNLGATPCCGLIRRTWECVPKESSETGFRHISGKGVPDRSSKTGERRAPDGPYVPEFPLEQYLLFYGRCPDCGIFFTKWLQGEEAGGFAIHKEIYPSLKMVSWHYDYNRALVCYMSIQPTD